MEDKMVELVRFTKVSEAEILANLLKSEGIDSYVRDGFMNQIYNGLDLGGVKVELLEKDRERAMEIMKDYGYLSPVIADSESSADLDELAVSEDYIDDMADDEKNKTKLSRNMTVIIALIILLGVIIVFLNKYFNNTPIR